MTEKTKIEGCPFCGSRKTRNQEIYSDDYGGQMWVVICLSCDVYGPPAKSKGWSARKWNQRGSEVGQ